ncbi:hypothetical protein SESBI_49805, partial [Sesbania bispinosa]
MGSYRRDTTALPHPRSGESLRRGADALPRSLASVSAMVAALPIAVEGFAAIVARLTEAGFGRDIGGDSDHDGGQHWWVLSSLQ